MNKKDFDLVEPNIYKHKIQQKYVVDIYLGKDENNKQQRTTKTFYDLKSARECLILLKADRVKGTAKKKARCSTIFELIKSYKEIYQDGNIADTTSSAYQVIENHLSDFFDTSGENSRIDKITATTIEKYYRYLKNIKTKRNPNGLSPNTIKKHHFYIQQIFSYACKHQETYGIVKNPMNNVMTPKKVDARIPNFEVYDNALLHELYECLEDEPLPFQVAVRIGMNLGLRRGEINYLKWSDIDFNNDKIYVRGCRTCANKEVIKDTPKNGSSRSLVMPENVKEILLKYKTWQENNKKLLGSEYIENYYVLVRADGKEYAPKWLSRAMKNFIKKNELPELNFHSLRHINCSLLVRVMPLIDVAKNMGHKTLEMTNAYAESLTSNEEMKTKIEKCHQDIMIA